MALISLFANSTIQQVLASGDDFVLGAGATLAVNNLAIFGTGATESTLFGNVFSTGDSALYIAAGSTTELVIGDAANIVSLGLHAIEIESTSSIDVHTAGTIASTPSTAVVLGGTGVDPNVTIDFFNSGTITAGLTGVHANAGQTQIVFNNAGTITGKTTGAILDSDNSTIYFNNSGTISGTTREGVEFLGTSGVEAVNTGTISTAGNAAVSFSSGTFTNTGTLSCADATAFRATGEVTLRNTGVILGDINLGAGNDAYLGFFGRVEGGVRGGDGDDLILASREDDVLLGDNGADSIYGKGDDDFIFGGNDDDHLYGNRGDDTLIGGRGQDHLRGGVGADIFLFEVGDSGLRANADVIADFSRRADKIDVSQMGGLDFIGTTRFSGGGTGELRLKVKRNGDTLVQIDADGDGRADMHIIVEDASRLTEDHFIL